MPDSNCVAGFSALSENYGWDTAQMMRLMLSQDQTLAYDIKCVLDLHLDLAQMLTTLMTMSGLL